MSKELAKTYDPKGTGGPFIQKWLDSGYFHAEVDRSEKTVHHCYAAAKYTGQLHMGHALDKTMQDILIRYKRMQGYEALWQPGTDHAAIATEVKVINKLKEQGIDKNELGREGFLKTSLGVERRVRRHDRKPAEEAGLLLLTGTESVSRWTRAVPRRYRKYLSVCIKRIYLQGIPYHQLVSGLPDLYL